MNEIIHQFCIQFHKIQICNFKISTLHSLSIYLMLKVLLFCTFCFVFDVKTNFCRMESERIMSNTMAIKLVLVYVLYSHQIFPSDEPHVIYRTVIFIRNACCEISISIALTFSILMLSKQLFLYFVFLCSILRTLHLS